MKAISKHTFSIVFLLFVFTTFCYGQLLIRDYRILLTTPYNSLKENDQKKYSDQLALAISEDPDYKLVKQSMKNLMNHVVTKDRSKTVDKSIPRPTDQKALIQYYANQGFSDPKGYLDAQNQMVAGNIKVLYKFPVLSKLEKTTAMEIMKRARKGFTADEARIIKKGM